MKIDIFNNDLQNEIKIDKTSTHVWLASLEKAVENYLNNHIEFSLYEHPLKDVNEKK